MNRRVRKAANDTDTGNDLNVMRPVNGSRGPGSADQSVVMPGTTEIETEELLDIVALLEITRLIGDARKEGRLGKR